jgi:hypothetical protein
MHGADHVLGTMVEPVVIMRRLEKSAPCQRGCAIIAIELRRHEHGERDALALDRVEGRSTSNFGCSTTVRRRAAPASSGC